MALSACNAQLIFSLYSGKGMGFETETYSLILGLNLTAWVTYLISPNLMFHTLLPLDSDHMLFIFISFFLLPVPNTSLGWYWGFCKAKKLLITPLGTNSIFLAPYFLLSSLTCNFKPCPRCSKRSLGSTLPQCIHFLGQFHSIKHRCPSLDFYQPLEDNWTSSMW